MSKHLISIRVSQATQDKLNYLADRHGTQTEAVAVAIDRLYQQEARMEVARHKSGEGTVVLKESDRGYIVTVHKEALPPHYSKLHDTYQEAAADFERLARREEPVYLSGDLHQAQEEAWNGNVNASPADFLNGDDIEEAVDAYLEQYSEMFNEPMPTYRLQMTGSIFTLRELLVGYLDRQTD